MMEDNSESNRRNFVRQLDKYTLAEKQKLGECVEMCKKEYDAQVALLKGKTRYDAKRYDANDIYGLRVVNVYDVDNKTYLIKLSSAEKKMMILIESGNRVHSTEFEWPKHMMPSGFSMKCRKHLRNKRLVYVKQLGDDRIVDFCFGYNEAAHHLIVELYDRGNIVLADYEFTILQLLRIRKDNDDVRFAVRERYPVEKARPIEPPVTSDRLKEILQNAKDGELLKRILNPSLIFGPALLEHCLLEANFKSNCKFGSDFLIDRDIDKLLSAIKLGEEIITAVSNGESKGYIIQKADRKRGLNSQSDAEELLTYSEFQPYLFKQHEGNPHVQFSSFNKAVDEFFSKLESQKLDIKTLQLEQNALKKLENVKQDHYKRLEGLQNSQDVGLRKAALIELNLPLVDQAIKVVNSAIANQINWEEINDIVKEAQLQGDPVACSIKELKLDANHIMMKLIDPYAENIYEGSFEENQEEEMQKKKKKKPDFTMVDIDLGSTAFANARNYHDKRRHAASKEQKTIDASAKALKSAEKKAKQTLKEVATSAQINKARKQYWFEKFLWFISSENYLVIAGRDQQQNEILVKRYLKAGDLYVHADLHGASSVILKNPSKQPVPPRTLNEAGTMAICYSAAWQARVVTSAWWVYHYQVSKTAPSGEYLTTGSFMIRGKKNYLPPSYLMMGFGIMFKIDESCVQNHVNERKAKFFEEASQSAIVGEIEDHADEQENEIDLGDTDGEEEHEKDDSERLEVSMAGAPDDSKDSTGESHDQVTDSCDRLNGDHGQSENEDALKEPSSDDIEGECKSPKAEISLSNESDEEGEEPVYPDTSIQLRYVSGERFQLQRGVSASAKPSVNDHRDESGESRGTQESKKDQLQKKPRLSAKQRRDLKKKSKHGETNTKTSSDNIKQVEEAPLPEAKEVPTKDDTVAQQSTQQPPKRGQKGKKKKMKEKYKDQDEEDKQIIMQLLGSAGDGKDQKGKKKGKKGSRSSEGPRSQSGKSSKRAQPQPLILSSESLDGAEASGDLVLADASGQVSTVKEDQIDEEDEGAATEDVDKENISLLDTLTSHPVAEDLLLFAIPTCAPYNTMQNYKYKVKVTPGTGRKGKAAKTAIHLFSMSKDASQREKDLFRSLKDVDVSRNIPGKVKISAPNLQKSKK